MNKILSRFIFIITIVFSIGFTACNNSKSHTVTFMNGSTIFDTQKIDNGKTAVKLETDPVKTDYTFDNWYESIKSDGTGNGLAFKFTTTITKDITLYAAFTLDESPVDTAVTVVELMCFYQNTSRTINVGDKFSASGPFDYIWEVAVLEEYSGFEISNRYNFLDITTLTTNSNEKEESICYEYSNESNNLYYFYEVYESGFIYFEVADTGDNWDAGFTVTYQRFGQTTVIISKENSGLNEYYIIDNNGNRKTYQFVDYIELGAGFVVSEANCYNGALLISRGDEVLKDDYIALVFNGAGLKTTIYVRAGEEFILPKGNNENASYIYTISGVAFTDNKISQEMFDNYKANGYITIIVSEAE